jgi:hypothetical protein
MILPIPWRIFVSVTWVLPRACCSRYLNARQERAAVMMAVVFALVASVCSPDK